MFASFTSLLPSALQLHASPEKSNPTIASDFRPDNEEDDDEATQPSGNGGPGQSSVNEFGQVKDQKGKEKKGLSETFIFVRPPPSKTNHPLNLQVQLVPPNSRGPTGLTPTSTTSVNSSAYLDGNTPVTATPARTSFDQGPRRQGTDDSIIDLSRTSTNRSDASTAVYTSGYSSVASLSSVASTASSSSGRRTIIPLYNLQAHNVLTNTIVDAGTDAKIAKFQKRGLEMIGLAMLEPVEVWPSSSDVAAQMPSTPGTTVAFPQPRSNRTSIDSRRPPHNGSGFLHAHQDKSSRPVTPTLSEDTHGHTPTSSRLSVSSAGVDTSLHQVRSKDGYQVHQQQVHHPYLPQVATPPPDGMQSIEGSSAGAKKNIFGKLFKRKGPNTTATPDLSTYSPLPSPTPGVSISRPKASTPKGLSSPVPASSPSPTSPEMATTPTMPSSSSKFTSGQHLSVGTQQHHRAPSAPVVSKSDVVGEDDGESATPRNKRQAASFNLPGFINKGSALIGRGMNGGGRKPPSPVPPPFPPREHAPASEDSTATTTTVTPRNVSGRNGGSRAGEGHPRRDSGFYGPITPTDSSGSVNVHASCFNPRIVGEANNPPTPTPASQQNQAVLAPAQALRPPVLGIQPSLSVVPAGSRASNGNSNRATMYVWIVRRWFKGSDTGLLGNLGKIGSGVIGLGLGDEKKKGGSTSNLNKGSDVWNLFEVRFEWKRGKTPKAGKKKDGERQCRRASLIIGNPPPPRDRSRTAGSETRRASRAESKGSLRASAEGHAADGAEVDESPKDKAGKRLSLLSQKTTSTKTSDEQLEKKVRSRSRPRARGDAEDDEEEDDGEESDPEDSETPWTCTLKVKRLPARPTGDLLGASGGSLLAPLTLTTSRSPRSSAYSRNSLDLTGAPLIATATQPQTLKLKLGTLSPTPHHPKVVAMLKVPFPLSDVEVEGMTVRKRTLPGHRLPREPSPRRPATSSGVVDSSGNNSGGPGLELTAEELKDVVCSTGMWLVVREGFGGVGKERRRGDGWRIRA